MKREGAGDPRDPDIAICADVRVGELRFEEVPDPEVRFWGNTERDSVWESRRENLPDEVRQGVTYRDARVRLRIASEIADGGGGFQNTLDGEGVKIRPRKDDGSA